MEIDMKDIDEACLALRDIAEDFHNDGAERKAYVVIETIEMLRRELKLKQLW
jgi:hypothetical protein